MTKSTKIDSCIKDCKYLDEETIKLTCGHHFHKKCLNEYFNDVDNDSENVYCDKCNIGLTIDDLDNVIDLNQFSEFIKNTKIIDYVYNKHANIFTQKIFDMAVVVDNIAMIKFLVSVEFTYDIYKAFLNACINGSLNMILILNKFNTLRILNKASINEIIWKSVISNKDDLVEYVLVYYKSTMNDKIDRNEERLSLYAVSNNNLTILKYLVEFEFKVHSKLLQIAITEADINLVQYIYEYLYNKIYTFSLKDIERVIKFGQIEVLKYILTFRPLFGNSENKKTISKIRMAAASGNTDMVEFLYQYGISNGELHENLIDHTVIEHACLNPSCEMFEYFDNYGFKFSHKAIMNLCTNGTKCHISTALMNTDIVFSEQHFDILCERDELYSVQLLIDCGFHGSDLSVKYAVENNSLEMVRILIKSGYRYIYPCNSPTSNTVIMDAISIFQV